MTRNDLSRRKFAAALGTALGVGLAGCGAGAGNNTTNGTGGTNGTVANVTEEGTTVEETTANETTAEETTGEGAAVAVEPVEEPSAAVSEGMSVVRIAHLSPDAPNVDISIAGQQVLTDVGYTDVSQYYALEPGTYPVTVTATGESEPVLEREIEFQVGAFTVGAFGEVSGNNEELAINVFDDEVEPPSEGTSVRVVHASPDAPPISVTAQEANVTVDGISFAQASEYVDAQAGDYEFQISAAQAGATGAANNTTTGNATTGTPMGNATTDNATTGNATTTGTPVGTTNGTMTGTPMGNVTTAGNATGNATTGTTGTAQPGSVVATADVSLEEGTVMTLFVTGYATPQGESGDAPLEVVAVVDAGAAAGAGTATGTANGTANGTATGTANGTVTGTANGTATGTTTNSS